MTDQDQEDQVEIGFNPGTPEDKYHTNDIKFETDQEDDILFEEETEIKDDAPGEDEQDHDSHRHHPPHSHSHHINLAKKRPFTKKLLDQIAELENSLEEANKDRDDYKDRFIRNLAEMDNYRKRVKKEKEEFQKYILADFLVDLLQVYDNLERALKAKCSPLHSISNDEKSIISGVEMILKQFSDLLKKYNVVEVEAMDKPFDPLVHNALSKTENPDVIEPTVVEVYQKGFLYNGKLLKPSLVKVAVPPEPETPNPDSNEPDENQE